MPDHYPNTTNKGISASKFMDGSPALGKESNVGKLANITRRVTIRVGKVEKVSALNAEKITKLKNITQLRKENVDKKISGSSSGLLDALNGINDNITGMMSILIEQQKFDRKKAENERKESEKARRGASEKKLESKAFEGLKGIANKVLAPIKSLWGQIWDFLSTLFLGRVAVKLWKWFSDKENQKKIEAVGRFFKDWWPALLTGFLLFGTGLGKLITWMGVKLVAWGGTLLLKVIPALMGAIAAMGPWGWAALALVAGGGSAIYLHNRNERLREEDNEEDDESTVTPKEFTESRQDDDQTNDLTPSGSQLMNETVQQTGLGLMFNRGGQVPGSGNSDSVSTKLTPGEFVVSAPAVQQWGADTFSAMNAMGGGGNTGSISRGFSEGGLVSKNMWNPMNWFGGSGSGEKKGVTDKDKSKLTPEKGGISRNAKALLNTIRWAEGTLKPGGYNTWFGGRTDMDLTKMTIDEVVDEQKRRLKAGEATYGRYTSAAVGAYQMMLPEVYAPMAGLTGSSLFTPENQDKMAIASYMKGKLTNKEIDSPISRETIAKISGVWSSLPTMSGASAHGQPVKKYSDLEKVYNKNLKSLDPKSYSAATTSIALGKGSTSVPGGGGSGGTGGTGGTGESKKESGSGWFGSGWTGSGASIGSGWSGSSMPDLAAFTVSGQMNKPNIPPPTKPKTTIAYTNEKEAQQDAQMPAAGMSLPTIGDPSAMVSDSKIKTLGVSV